MIEWDCQTVFENLSAYMDDELDSQQRLIFETHVRRCTRCQQFGEEFMASIAALRSIEALPSASRQARIIDRLIPNRHAE